MLLGRRILIPSLGSKLHEKTKTNIFDLSPHPYNPSTQQVSFRLSFRVRLISWHKNENAGVDSICYDFEKQKCCWFCAYEE